ncbi:MAG: hypothetical protein U0235_32200 [Polyangiaceae bacterium]
MILRQDERARPSASFSSSKCQGGDAYTSSNIVSGAGGSAAFARETAASTRRSGDACARRGLIGAVLLKDAIEARDRRLGARRRRFDERRAFAATPAPRRVTNRVVHREEIVTVDGHGRESVGHTARARALADRIGRAADGDEHDRQLEDASEVERVVDLAARKLVFVEERERDGALLLMRAPYATPAAWVRCAPL